MNQNYKYINVEFKNTTTNTVVDFNFTPMLENAITHRWLELVEMATELFEIDQPERFYGFDAHELEIAKALGKIKKDIAVINDHHEIITRELVTVHDQDTLNYLHHIFEIYHGLLDKQTSSYWGNAPPTVRNALADLNIDVHRCEALQTETKEPRFVSTWYGMPKTHHLFDEDYQLFTNNYKFGTIYLTYAEIGKTLEHLCKDKELSEHSYAAPEAFKPYDYFSADMHVRFHNRQTSVVLQENSDLCRCYDANEDFFIANGYQKNDARLLPGALPVATLATELTDEEVIYILSTHQYVNKVQVIK
jgi:hypothetical protein